jgi:hypothetical protein
LVPGTVKLLHHIEKETVGLGTRRNAGLTTNRLLMRADNSTGKYAPGMDKFGSGVDRMYKKLEADF